MLDRQSAAKGVVQSLVFLYVAPSQTDGHKLPQFDKQNMHEQQYVLGVVEPEHTYISIYTCKLSHMSTFARAGISINPFNKTARNLRVFLRKESSTIIPAFSKNLHISTHARAAYPLVKSASHPQRACKSRPSSLRILVRQAPVR